MKFNNLLDLQTFLLEIKEYDLAVNVSEDFNPTNEQVKSFLKARTPLVKKMKDHRKSSTQKANWRGNRHKMMKGIKAFHKSVEGKRFHKRLGRFMATRILRQRNPRKPGKSKKCESFFVLMEVKKDYLLGLNAAKQHLFVELQYFHTLQEQVEFEEFLVDYALPYFRVIEEKILADEELTNDELTFIYDLTRTDAMLQSFSERLNTEFAEIEKVWNSIVGDLNKNGTIEEDETFFPKAIATFQELLGKQK